MAKELEVGSIRIKSGDLRNFKKIDEVDWEFFSNLDSAVLDILRLYEEFGNFDLVLDDHCEGEFLKGSLSPDLKISGARIMFLPDGRKLARAGFSLFAEDLRFNSSSERLWDVCYMNASGLKTYLYCEEKVHLEQDKKLKLVELFEKHYLEIFEKCEDEIKSCKDVESGMVYFGLYVMLNTFVRVGNLEYFRKFGHKGLTTLQKKDISFDNNFVAFDFVGKDGVPQSIEKEFPEFFVSKFRRYIDGLKRDSDFIFMKGSGFILHSDDFSKLMFKWTGEHFYPHIVRSHYADMRCKEFLKKRRSASREEVENVFMEIAENLGHKKFNKKTECWEPNFSVTLKNYIHPKYSEKMIELYSDSD